MNDCYGNGGWHVPLPKLVVCDFLDVSPLGSVCSCSRVALPGGVLDSMPRSTAPSRNSELLEGRFRKPAAVSSEMTALLMAPPHRNQRDVAPENNPCR